MHVPVSLSSPVSAKSLPEAQKLSQPFSVIPPGWHWPVPWQRSSLNKISGSCALLRDRPSQSLVLTRNGGILCWCWQTGQALTICPVGPPRETKLRGKPHATS